MSSSLSAALKQLEARPTTWEERRRERVAAMKRLVPFARRQLQEQVGPAPAQTLRAHLDPDGVWRIIPYGKLARFPIEVSPRTTTVRGFGRLFTRSPRYRRNGGPILIPHILSRKALGAHGKEIIPALNTFSGVPLKLVLPYVKREALNLLPVDVRRIMARVQVSEFDDEMINHVWSNLESILEVEAKAPSLLPIALRQGIETNHRFEPSISGIHYYLFQQGVTKPMWRYLLKMSIRAVRALFIWTEIDGAGLQTLKWLSMTQEPVRAGCVRFLCHQLRREHEDVIVDSLRAFLREANRSRNLRQLVNDSGDVFDYLRNETRTIEAMDHNQRSVPWSVWEARSVEWHQRPRPQWEGDDEVFSRKSDLTWETDLPTFTEGDFTATALTTSAMLREEGKAMHHCIATYDDECGETGQIYSIRKKGKRVASLFLRLREALGKPGTHVTVGQVRGPCNEDPSLEVQAFVHKLRAAYRKAIADKPVSVG